MSTKASQTHEPAVDETDSPAVPAVDVMSIIANDEYAGQGGSYVLDPVTGVRTKVDAS